MPELYRNNCRCVAGWNMIDSLGIVKQIRLFEISLRGEIKRDAICIDILGSG